MIVEGMDRNEWVRQQQEDKALTYLLKWFQDHSLPSESDLMLLGKEPKFYVLNKDLFVLKDGLLYRREEGKDLLVVAANPM